MLYHMIPVVLHKPVEKQPLHPLHIAISIKDLHDYVDSSIPPKEEGHFNGALVVDLTSPSKNVFVTVHGMIINSEDAENEFLHLHVTEKFLIHYKFFYGQKLFFRLINCIPISKVVFGAKSEESYLWAQHKKWHKDFLLAVCKTKPLCRLHDVLLVSPAAFMLEKCSLCFDLITVACEPVEQGLLTTNTKVVVLDIHSTLIYQTVHPDLSFFPNCNSCLSSSNFIGNTRNEQLQTVPRDHNVTQPDFSEQFFTFQVQIIPKFDSVYHKAVMEADGVLDPLNTVFVTSDVLGQTGLHSGAFVKARLRCSDSVGEAGNELNDRDKKRKFRSVSLCCIENEQHSMLVSEPSAMVVYMSPHLWFNLNSHPSKLIQEECQLLIEPFKFDNVSSPPYAKEVFVALVQSPCYNGSINCDTMLKNYFKDPRYIAKGDIFCIDTRDAVEFDWKSQDTECLVKPLVYFRVSMIEGPTSDYCGYLIDHEHTRLYQAGTAQSYIPVMMEMFHSLESDPFFLNCPVPPGLSYYVDVLEEIIEPVLSIQNNCKFQVSSNILLTGAAGSGKTTVVHAICGRLNLHLYQVNCHELLGESSATIEARLKVIIEKASVYAPCVMLLKNIDFIGREKELKGENARVLSSLSDLLRSVNNPESEWPVIVIATSSYCKLTSSDLSAVFLHHIMIKPPSESERSEIIENLLRPCLIGYDVSPEYVAVRTAGFTLADLCGLVLEASKNRYLRLKSLLIPSGDLKLEEDVCLAGFPIIRQDFHLALDKMHADNAEASGTAKIPNVTWEDVGGLSNVKQEILDTIHLPMEHPEILAAGLRRSGVLLYGPPGTGKTLLAKAVATECSLNFMSIKGPELINMYVGQSEENVRAVFDQARSSVPCIIFFDELDSLAPNRGRSGDSGGVMDRVVSQLLSEIDGLHTSSQLFVIGATNRPDLIDPALLRPGRFDRLVYVGVAKDVTSKLSILKALTRKLKLADDVNLEDIAENCPPYLSGADLYSLCSNAMMHRIEKNVELVEQGLQKLEDVNILIQKEDFEVASEKLVPSVSEQELARYEEIKRKL